MSSQLLDSKNILIIALMIPAIGGGGLGITNMYDNNMSDNPQFIQTIKAQTSDQIDIEIAEHELDKDSHSVTNFKIETLYEEMKKSNDSSIKLTEKMETLSEKIDKLSEKIEN